MTGAVKIKNVTESAIIARTANANTKLPLYSLNFLVIWCIFTQIRIFVNRTQHGKTKLSKATKFQTKHNYQNTKSL